jgi:hypothetical protein
MRKKEEIKRIERRARAMLLTKEIPPHKQELVRTLINNKQLDQKEKWRAVIELIQNCGDKEPVLYRERARVELVKKARPPVKKPVN